MKRMLGVLRSSLFSILLAYTLPVKALVVEELPCFWFGAPDDPVKAKYLERERIFSNYSWVYSVLSAYSYDTTMSKHSIPLPKADTWQEIGKVEEKDINQGFYARAWVRNSEESNELIISFRGTDSLWKDFYNGNFVFVPYLFGRTQFDSAISFTNSVIEEAASKKLSYEKIIFTGHSLGGGLAQYVQRFREGSQAIVFDPSPNKGRIYSLFNSKNDVNSVRVYEKGEILEIPRKLIDADRKWDWTPKKKGKSTIWMDFYDDGAIDGHSIDDLAMSLIRVSASTGNRKAISVIEEIESNIDSSELPKLTCAENTYRRIIRTTENSVID